MKRTLGVALGMALSLAASAVMAQTAASCPAGLDPVAQCYKGQDANGAFYWIAMPKQWNHTLIMHSHGGPRLSAITQESNIEDLRSEEHTSELQSHSDLVCRLLLEK